MILRLVVSSIIYELDLYKSPKLLIEFYGIFSVVLKCYKEVMVVKKIFFCKLLSYRELVFK